ncbi:transposase [Streptomyces griseolus]|uniref:transposase n=1 Tax=Streptomyces griseolus TaxID=1909 RepID=UPI002242F5BD|nr:transposase [Streptomyces griseolus]MCW8215805.1 transposase [Streptomyces griseolus]
MGRGNLTNHEWSFLEPHLPLSGGRGGRWCDHRTVINGILFRVRTGPFFREPWFGLAGASRAKGCRPARRRRGSAGGSSPAGFGREHYRRRNEAERTINRLKNVRAVATRYDKRAYVFHGTVTAEAIRL